MLHDTLTLAREALDYQLKNVACRHGVFRGSGTSIEPWPYGLYLDT